MKNVCIIFLLSIIISLTAVGFSDAETKPQYTEQYLRIHIRADSNDGAAQSVKYEVRDVLVQYLTPLVAEYSTTEKAVEGVRKHLSHLAEIATQTLKNKGFDYGATAMLKTEEFPTRIYGEYALPKGEYLALIVNLGSGQGDNWWCVVYPPLCFSNPVGKNIIYKSKILEIIEEWKK